MMMDHISVPIKLMINASCKSPLNIRTRKENYKIFGDINSIPPFQRKIAIKITSLMVLLCKITSLIN